MIIKCARFKPERIAGRWKWLVDGDRSYWSHTDVPDDANSTMQFLRVYIKTRVSPYRLGQP